MTSLSPASGDDVLARVAAPPDAVVRYAAHGDGVIDLHLPDERGPHPLVVTLHGGFWKQEFDRRHLRPLARALVADGCVVAAPEYRRVGGAGGWPMTGDDVLAAFTALPALLDGLGVATSSVTVLGHSAGGQLALWLAAQGGGIDRVVALAPVADLVAAARDGLGGGATQALLGGLPSAVPEAYAEADPLGLLGFAAPATRITVLHGRTDPDVPIDQARSLARRHPRVDLDELACGHFEVIDPLSAQWPSVRAAVLGDVA
ncbi:MAG: alpha/beta hydrolase [Nocardioides sp.]